MNPIEHELASLDFWRDVIRYTKTPEETSDVADLLIEQARMVKRVLHMKDQTNVPKKRKNV